MKICLTGGIACGKSLLSRCLNGLGVETLDADDIVHELIPAEERRRLAAVVFNDPARRRELEARIHPLVRKRIDEFLAGAAHRADRNPSGSASRSLPENRLRIAVIPLLFEAHWESDYDIIVCVAAERSKQIERMVTMRGYTREEAEARLAAQMDVAIKARKSHYTVWNNGSEEKLKNEAVRLVAWLKKERNSVGRTVPVSRSRKGSES